MFAYVLAVSGLCFAIAAGGALLIRHRRPTIQGRTGECSVCGLVLVGGDWWTLTTVPPAIPGEPTHGGGTVLQQDFCRKHAPDLRHH